MNPTTTLLDIPIKDVAAQIFSRPCLFVNPTAYIFQIATYLAIGPQIYVDGLIVINESKKPIGIISSKHIIFNIINTGYPEWLKITAEQIMDDFAGTVDMNSPLSKVLKIFDKTRFAFVPIIASNSDKNIRSRDPTASQEVVASLSIRDILPLIAKMNIGRPIKDLCSPLMSVDKNNSVRNVIDLMIKYHIRNIGIREASKVDENIIKTNKNKDKNNKTKLIRIINDRKILEFLLSHNGRNIMQANGVAGLANINIINHLNILSTKKVECDTATSKAAKLLMDIRNPCLILEGKKYDDYSIVTPWDIVMKTSEIRSCLG